MSGIRSALQPKSPPYIDVDTAVQTGWPYKHTPRFYVPVTKQGHLYWTDGKKVYWCQFQISSDVDNFVFYNNDFAHDSKHCFVRQKKLRQVDPASFEVLNNSFARDSTTVWTGERKLIPADISTFEVYEDCISSSTFNRAFIDGKEYCTRTVNYLGYARDSKAVYCSGIGDSIKVVKKADPETFVSSSCGCYGWDSKHVFWHHLILPKADLRTWHGMTE